MKYFKKKVKKEIIKNNNYKNIKEFEEILTINYYKINKHKNNYEENYNNRLKKNNNRKNKRLN